MDKPPLDKAAVIAATEDWVVKAVLGLNLCPFAHPVHAGGKLRYAVTDAANPEALLEVLVEELQWLATADPDTIETTLLIHPRTLDDFLDFNDFLDVADAAVEELGLGGELQVASFHPAYQFEGTAPDDIDNFTNRAPYPILHLLRESSIERAVATVPDTDRIYERNVATLRRIGLEGWKKLGIGPAKDE